MILHRPWNRLINKKKRRKLSWVITNSALCRLTSMIYLFKCYHSTHRLTYIEREFVFLPPEYLVLKDIEKYCFSSFIRSYWKRERNVNLIWKSTHDSRYRKYFSLQICRSDYTRKIYIYMWNDCQQYLSRWKYPNEIRAMSKKNDCVGESKYKIERFLMKIFPLKERRRRRRNHHAIDYFLEYFHVHIRE